MQSEIRCRHVRPECSQTGSPDTGNGKSPVRRHIYYAGCFHIEMAIIKAIGKLIAESGRPKMLTECGVLATGSLRGFLDGKHFNRCKRQHPILALVFETQHFNAFLATYESKDEIRDMLQEFEFTQERIYPRKLNCPICSKIVRSRMAASLNRRDWERMVPPRSPG